MAVPVQVDLLTPHRLSSSVRHSVLLSPITARTAFSCEHKIHGWSVDRPNRVRLYPRAVPVQNQTVTGVRGACGTTARARVTGAALVSGAATSRRRPWDANATAPNSTTPFVTTT